MHFDTVFMAPRVRVALNSILAPAYVRKFWLLIDKLRSGRFDIKGLNVEKLYTRKGKVYSARLNVEIRVIFSMCKRGDRHSLVVWDVNHHDEAYDRVERVCVPFISSENGSTFNVVEAWGDGSGRPLCDFADEAQHGDDEELTDGLILFEVPHFVLVEPGRYSAFEKNIDRYLKLTEEQEELISRFDNAYVVRGSAGTGKTTLALFHALTLYERNPEDDIFLFTYQEELACVCRCYKVNLVGEEEIQNKEDEGGLRVFSFLEFCRHYLKKQLDVRTVGWQIINHQTSIEYLSEIICSKQRWARTIEPEDTYSYIYSILKGRFVPGTDRIPESQDDYRRIFRDYGSTPSNLDDILEVFALYQGRLARCGQKDEADLIATCYVNLKNKALLSTERRATWIVIDEIQDFTELEWKSILLFWENKCRVSKSQLSFPFVSGDRNQNISRSGFRWQEVDSYIESILKKMHRPNALTKVQLHKNFRNTLEIFKFGKFLRDRHPERAGDLGIPPNFSGRKPLLVVGEEAEFVDFLCQISGGNSNLLPAPLVVLFENETDLKSMKQRLPLDDGLFLMQLAKSKGMEFEDCVLYRLFSTVSEINQDTGQDRIARLFDLWYMGITRGRKNLLVFLTPSDWSNVTAFFSSHCEELNDVVDLKLGQTLEVLQGFYENCEKYIPNYNVIFLERVKAQEAWDEAQRLEGDQASVSKKEALRQQSLRLWRKCRDWANLGKAYMNLTEYEQAIPFLTRANLTKDVAWCYEQIGNWGSAAHYYEEDHCLSDAARCYAQAGQYSRAAEIFEMEQQWLLAATHYSKSGASSKAASCYERAEKFEEAAKYYSIRGEWLRAAELFKKCGAFSQAAEMYLKVKDKLDAAKCFNEAGELERAGKLFESLNRWEEAAMCFEKASMFSYACNLFSKAGMLKNAALCAEKVGNWSSAALLYERIKNFTKAGDAYLALGSLAKAAECFENAQDWTKALPLLLELKEWYRLARCCERLDDLPRAIEYYLMVNGFSEAANCYVKSEMWTEAYEFFLKAKEFTQAAIMLTKLGRRLEAARLFLLDGQVAAAMELARSVHKSDSACEGKQSDLRLELANWAEQNGRFDVAAQVYEYLGQHMLAAYNYKKAAMLGKAANCFERAGKLLLASELYMLEGKYLEAANCFRSAGHYKEAGEAFEKSHAWVEASQMYEVSGDHESAKRCRLSAQWLS